MNGSEKDRPRRVLLMGDYSNCQLTLKGALEQVGCSAVTLASDGSRWLDTGRDIDISRPAANRLGGLALWLRLKRLIASGRLSGYDAVVINHPIFLDLKPARNMAVFNELKKRNGAVFLAAMSHDYRYVKMCCEPGSPLPYSEWALFGEPSPMRVQRPDEYRGWTTDPVRAQNEAVYRAVDGITTGLYEYHLSVSSAGLPAEKVCYTGLPIATRTIPVLAPAEKPSEVNIFLGRHSRRLDEKGTDILEHAARMAVERNPGRAQLTIVEDRPYAEYSALMRRADIVLDQLYSHTPAMNALLAMAMGKIAVTGGEPAYYDFIGEHDNRPIINPRPDDFEGLVAALDALIKAPAGELRSRGLQSRAFVEKHNAAEVVAQRSLTFWAERIAAKTAEAAILTDSK